MVVLDTCAIIEAIKSSPSFSLKILKQINLGAYLLSISFAEVACKIKMGKLIIDTTPQALFDEFTQVNTIEIVNIGVQEWLDSIDLIWPKNKDPADRVITAFAAKRQLPIVTTDKKIKDFYPEVIW